MPVPIPLHIQGLNSYKPGKPIAQIMAENGLEEVAILWNNENPLGTSPKAIAAVQQALSGSNRYPDPMGLDLRNKIAMRSGHQTDQIVIGNGGEAILMNILKAFCQPGDELLTADGSFVITYIWSQINNLPCHRIALRDDYGYDLKAIQAAVNEKTRVIYLANANNPTGSMISRTELNNFLDNIPSSILVIVDEAYFEFSMALSEEYPDSSKMGYDNVISLRTLSKSYGLAAIRLGYAIGPPRLIQPLLDVKLTFEPSNLAQAAALAALDDDEFLERTLKNNQAGLNFFYKKFDEIGIRYVRSFANFVMIHLDTASQANSLFQQLMKRGVFVRTLGGSGLPHCLRISVGTAQENKFCVRALEKEMLLMNK